MHRTVRLAVQQSNILLTPLPTTIEIGGTEYEIDSDFRTAIRFALLMQDSAIADNVKLDIALYMFFGEADILNVEEAVEQILLFYQCGKTDKKGGSGKAPAKRVYDFEYDADLIFSAFLEQYGIDLQKIAYLHWWKFRALFVGLSENTEFMKIVGYRSVEITGDMSKAQKAHYKKLKALYALPDNRTEEEKERDFACSLARL